MVRALSRCLYSFPPVKPSSTLYACYHRTTVRNSSVPAIAYLGDFKGVHHCLRVVPASDWTLLAGANPNPFRQHPPMRSCLCRKTQHHLLNDGTRRQAPLVPGDSARQARHRRRRCPHLCLMEPQLLGGTETTADAGSRPDPSAGFVRFECAFQVQIVRPAQLIPLNSAIMLSLSCAQSS